jgi:hypothetical protein
MYVPEVAPEADVYIAGVLVEKGVRIVEVPTGFVTFQFNVIGTRQVFPPNGIVQGVAVIFPVVPAVAVNVPSGEYPVPVAFVA